MPYQIKYSKTLLYAATDAIIDGKVVKSRNNIISPETEDEILTEIYKKIQDKSWEDVILVQEKDIVHLYLPKKDTSGKREITQTFKRPPYAYLGKLVKEGKIVLHIIDEG